MAGATRLSKPPGSATLDLRPVRARPARKAANRDVPSGPALTLRTHVRSNEKPNPAAGRCRRPDHRLRHARRVRARARRRAGLDGVHRWEEATHARAPFRPLRHSGAGRSAALAVHAAGAGLAVGLAAVDRQDRVAAALVRARRGVARRSAGDAGRAGSWCRSRHRGGRRGRMPPCRRCRAAR
jgi:hypothetical protein